MNAMTRLSLSVGIVCGALLSSATWATEAPIQPKVMLITMFAPEGFVPALENLYRTGNPLVQEILQNWSAWEKGVPEV